MTKPILVRRDDWGCARLTMNDRESNNTFTDRFIGELIESLDRIAEEKPHVLILSGLPDVFCAGAEKQNLLDLCDGIIHVKDLLISEKLLDVPFPVIAAMEGHAIGGGLVMACCCDIILAARESRYGAVFMQLGFTPGMGCTTLLADVVGPNIAYEMMFTGKCFKGRELAQKSTNINYILPRGDVMPKAEDLAFRICEKNRDSLYLLRRTLSFRKKRLLNEARLQEDLMHRISFSLPETRAKIEEFYAGGIDRGEDG